VKIDADDEVGRRHMARRLVRPFDQTDRIFAEIFSETGIDKLFRMVETIKIKVIPV